MNQKARLKQELDRRRASTAHWMAAAEDLYEAARLLWTSWRKEIEATARRSTLARPLRSRFSDGIPKMLAGMAIEDLLKATVVAQKGTPSANSHNLVKLAGEACIRLSQEETRLLDGLTHSVVWFGRYPAPKPNQEGNVMVTYFSDWSEFDALYRRLGAIIAARRKP